MHIVMAQTITESLNEGRTKQEFLKGAAYEVPDPIGQLWIGRGWATAGPVSPAPRVSPSRGKE